MDEVTNVPKVPPKDPAPLRPLLLTSTDLRASLASTVSVCWDEQGLEMIKEQQKKEREDRRQSEGKSDRRSSKESCESSNGR